MRTKLCVAVTLHLAQLLLVNRIHAGGLVAAWGGGGATVLPVGVNDVQAISTGFYHALALKADGGVIGWGSNPGGALNFPAGLSGIKAVTAGRSSLFSLALKMDGTVVAYGNTNYAGYDGVIDVPVGLSNVVAIAAGAEHALALKSNGEVVAWGDNGFGQTDVPTGLTNVTAIAAGRLHSLALKSDGTLVGWGRRFDDEPYVPVGLSNVVAIAAGEWHNLALKRDGTVAAWSHEGHYGDFTSVPAGLAGVIAIAAGSLHNLVLKADGKVLAWGVNYDAVNVPAGLTNVTAIAAGGFNNLALTSDGPVQITQNPQNQTFVRTSNAFFSVTADGSRPLGYQWLFNNQAITNKPRVSSATNSLIITNLQFSDAGTYRVIVSNAFGSVISSSAVLTVISPPFITSQSATNLIVGAGTNVTLSVSALGTPPLSFQWFFNGINLAGATGDTLSLTDVHPNLSGIYSLLVTNTYGATQVNIFLTVTDSPPYILNQPIGGVVSPGTSFTFTVSAHGSLPLGYQWRFNGQNISGATNANFRITNAHGTNTGDYQVIVTNAFGSATSTVTQLMVRYNGTLGNALNDPKLNAGATVVWSGSSPTNAPVWFAEDSITHDGNAAAQSGPVSDDQQTYLQTLVNGPGVLTFWWKVSSEEGCDVLRFSIDQTVWAEISGEVDWQQISFNIPGGTHWLTWIYSKDSNISAGQDAGWVDQVSFVQTFITQQPENQTAWMGSTVRLEVGVTFWAPPWPTFQWLKNGTNLPNANYYFLTLTNLTRRDSGIYVLQISSTATNVTSSNATVTVLVPQRIGTPELSSNGCFTFSSGDADGGLLLPDDLNAFQVQAGTDLTNWVTLTNALTVTDGILQIRDVAATTSPMRFYRIIETR